MWFTVTCWELNSIHFSLSFLLILYICIQYSYCNVSVHELRWYNRFSSPSYFCDYNSWKRDLQVVRYCNQEWIEMLHWSHTHINIHFKMLSWNAVLLAALVLYFFRPLYGDWTICFCFFLNSRPDLLGRFYMFGHIPVHAKQIYTACCCKVSKAQDIAMFTSISRPCHQGLLAVMFYLDLEFYSSKSDSWYFFLFVKLCHE